jgi:hypothetical protein
MNSLSWFLYLAETISNLQEFMFFILVVWGSVLGLYVFMCLLYTVLEGERPKYTPEMWMFVAFIILGVFANLIPSKNTIYLIAGSEVGEVVVTSEEGQAILNDIHEVIRAQLEGLKQ